MYHRPYNGYVGQVPEIPLYESLGIDDVLSIGNNDNFTNLIWSEGNPSFCKSIESFSKQLSKLDNIVRKMIVESLGLEKYMDEHIDSTGYAVRDQKYEGTQNHESQLGLLSHTDKNIITILCPNEVKGLEVLTKDGEWITADNSPKSFFVVAGDAFHAWTNGRVHSPHHRVMMAGDKVRYSIGLFSVPKAGSIIEGPREMVDVDHPLLFKPFDYSKFIDYVSASHATLANTLKTYCGA